MCFAGLRDALASRAPPPTAPRPATRARSWLAATGAFLTAFLASSHHWLHMLLLSLGVGAGFSALLFDPAARRAMLVLSLAMTALVSWWMWRRPHRALAERLALAASIAISLGLVAYAVAVHGW